MTDNKYQNGKIYTIRNKNNDTLIYVGSTIQPLHKRFHAHKNNAYNEKCKGYNILLYQKMRETNIEDWYIELYEDLPTERREQLNKREGEIIREIGTLNKNIAGRTIKESDKVYREANKDKYKEYREANNEANKEYQKKYYEANKEQKKEYREANKERINDKAKEYYEANKEQKKEYREANKEAIKERKKEYYEANKERIKDKSKEYRELNKDKYKEKAKEYYEANKERIKEHKRQRYKNKKTTI
jgi:hypothetical protein